MAQIMVYLGECFLCTRKECVSYYSYVNYSTNVNKCQLGKWVDTVGLAFYILIDLISIFLLLRKEF